MQETVTPEPSQNKWLEALYLVNDRAADTVLFLAQEYPGLALLALALVLYLSTVVKIQGVSLLEGMITLIPRTLLFVFQEFCELFGQWANALFSVARNLNQHYRQHFGASMASEAPLAIALTIVALGAMFLNFGLIYRPLQEWFSGSFVTPFGIVSAAFGAAAVIIAMELAAGVGFVTAIRQARMQGTTEGWRKYATPGVILAGLLLAILGGVEAWLALRREELIEGAQDTQDFLRSLDGTGGTQLKAVDEAINFAPAAVQAILGFVFPFMLAFFFVYIERFFILFMYGISTIPAIAFNWLEFLFRMAARVLSLICDLGAAIAGVVERLLGIVFWPAELLAKFLARVADRPSA